MFGTKRNNNGRDSGNYGRDNRSGTNREVWYNCGKCGKKGHKQSECPERSNVATEREIAFIAS